MKLKAEINNEKRDVEFSRDGTTLTASVDGRTYTIEASEPEPNVFLFKNDNKVTELSVSPPIAGVTSVRAGTHQFQVKIVDPKRLRGSATSDDSGDGTAEIRSAMPGKLVRIVAAVGTAVEKGDGVVVVEAMKMQNELKAAKDGVVKIIHFAEGDNVNAGDLLAVIE